MSTVTGDKIGRFGALLGSEEWRALARAVRAYEPDIVLPVARKMPRLAECLRLDFGPAKFFSDLATPYAHRHLRGSRVAVVDDVVNVGTTVLNACQKASLCGASEVKAFALAQRRGPKHLNGLEVDYVEDAPLTDEEHTTFSLGVPRALRLIPKPYDLEFPIIPCRLVLPNRTNRDLFVALTHRFGDQSVHDTTPADQRAVGVARYTVDLGHNRGDNYKVRFYLDEKEGLCNLVPFAIAGLPERNAEFRPASKWSSALVEALEESLSGAPENAEVVSGEAQFRLRLFAKSWDFALVFLEDLGELLIVDASPPLSTSDAQLLFGPDVVHALASVPRDITQSAELCETDYSELAHRAESPFVTDCPVVRRGDFARQVAVRASCASPYHLFLAVFEELSALVGATAPDTYQLDWPHTRTAIAKQPYLRLRIGPTFGDLIYLVNAAAKERGNERRVGPHFLSAALDWAIDEGAVVPTVARYGEYLFRVYRKGEADSVDEASNRALYALDLYPGTMSRTRMAKIFAALAFSRHIASATVPGSIERGSVAVFPSTVLDRGECEVTRRLRDTGKLR